MKNSCETDDNIIPFASKWDTSEQLLDGTTTFAGCCQPGILMLIIGAESAVVWKPKGVELALT
jgi:hypothetical protein